jgi:hypothetical protein
VWSDVRQLLPVDDVVYYVGDRESRRVKIGTSSNLATRFAALRRHYPRAVLLATEPGAEELERQRHEQFRYAWAFGEWFMRTSGLMVHVGAVRLEHGILNTRLGKPMQDRYVAALRA